MLYRKSYNVEDEFVLAGTAGDLKWKSTGCGEFIIAEKGGYRFFIKRYSMSGVRYPASSIPEPLYSKMLEDAKRIEEKQNDIMKRLSAYDVDSDHIVAEEENFWDENMFVTVTRMIPGENKDADYTVLDPTTFIKLCRDMVLPISKLHDAGVTHGDLKIKNVLIQESGTELIPYIIDFDSSYPSDYSTKKRADGKPMLAYPVVYSAGYESPEIAWYNYNDEGDVPAETITNKTDIFTLAIIFHKLWTNNFPAVEGDGGGSVGEGVFNGANILIDSKFNIPLGPVNESSFASLLKWMLAKEPESRPTAKQVFDALSDTLEVDDSFAPDGGSKFDTEPHSVHKPFLEILTKDELKALGVKSFLKGIAGGDYKYVLKLKDGTDKTLTAEEVISLGYGKAKSLSVCELWPEDSKNYELESAEVISSKGIASIERSTSIYRQFYIITERSGSTYTGGAATLLSRGIVKKKVEVTDTSVLDADTPWPEHGSAYNLENIVKRGILKVERAVEGGDNRYKLTFADKQVVVKASYMKLMNFIV